MREKFKVKKNRPNEKKKNSTDFKNKSSGFGYFYFIQTVPDLKKERIKMGFATSVKSRLNQHQTSSPTAKIYRHWRCKSCWERAAIDAISKCGIAVGGEVYDFNSLEEAEKKADFFFAMFD